MITVDELRECDKISVQESRAGSVIFQVELEDLEIGTFRIEIQAPSAREHLACEQASVQTLGLGGRPPPSQWLPEHLEGTLLNFMNMRKQAQILWKALDVRPALPEEQESGVEQVEKILRQAADRYIQLAAELNVPAHEVGLNFVNAAADSFRKTYDANQYSGIPEPDAPSASEPGPQT